MSKHVMRSTPDAARELIQHYEGFSATPYDCPAGYPTIGYGHVIRQGEKLPSVIIKAQAEDLLIEDLRTAERSVLRLIRVPLSDGQYGALVSFTFNLGGGKLQASTLRAKLNRGEYNAAADEFSKWIWAGGKRQRGLIRRRADERNMFMCDSGIAHVHQTKTPIISFNFFPWIDKGGVRLKV